MYERIFRPLFFQLDPEKAHDLTIWLLNTAGNLSPVRALLSQYFAHSHYGVKKNQVKAHSVNAFNLNFTNPVGLAAGYDKDGRAMMGLSALGFGHIEIGTVTPQPQDGNPEPRVFRIPEERALINRMGFPGRGADIVAQRLSAFNRNSQTVVLGVNIGKNKDTPNETAVDDYLTLLEKFTPLADYLTVNVSSPNTVGLRRLQARGYLEELLNQLAVKRALLSTQIPILVKLAPDLSDAELDDALVAVINAGMDGVIATNTTVSRKELRSDLKSESGGLSGAPLTKRSLDVVNKIYAKTSGKLPIVGVGGIMEPDDAKKMLDAGASLIQIYSGLVYGGPGLVKNILQAL